MGEGTPATRTVSPAMVGLVEPAMGAEAMAGDCRALAGMVLQWLRPNRIAVGRLDSRFQGMEFDPLAKEMEEDPQESAIEAAYTAAFLDWYHAGLKFGEAGFVVLVAGRRLPR